MAASVTSTPAMGWASSANKPASKDGAPLITPTKQVPDFRIGLIPSIL